MGWNEWSREEYQQSIDESKADIEKSQKEIDRILNGERTDLKSRSQGRMLKTHLGKIDRCKSWIATCQNEINRMPDEGSFEKPDLSQFPHIEVFKNGWYYAIKDYLVYGAIHMPNKTWTYFSGAATNGPEDATLTRHGLSFEEAWHLLINETSHWEVK